MMASLSYRVARALHCLARARSWPGPCLASCSDLPSYYLRRADL